MSGFLILLTGYLIAGAVLLALGISALFLLIALVPLTMTASEKRAARRERLMRRA